MELIQISTARFIDMLEKHVIAYQKTWADNQMVVSGEIILQRVNRANEVFTDFKGFARNPVELYIHTFCVIAVRRGDAADLIKRFIRQESNE